MVKEREQLAEAILNHALEIICLLTVEDYIIVKRPDGTRCAFSICATEVKSNTCYSTSGCPELSFTLLGMEDKTQRMIAQLANKIIQLLTREVKCGAVSVKDEREYLEGHGAQSKNSQGTFTIEQPKAPFQRSTEQSYPIKFCIKEEPKEKPHSSTGFSEAFEKYALPVQRGNLSNMVKEREQLAETILNHALEIICLLTVEDFIVVKRPDGTQCTFGIHATEVNRNVRFPPLERPELLFTLLGMEDKTQKMIAELASKIVQLLAREAPVKCADVSVLVSKDKWEHIAGPGEQYKNKPDAWTIEQPTAPVQPSTEKDYPIKSCIKNELEEEPPHSADKPASPVQQNTELSYPINLCIKKEPEKEPHYVPDQPTTPVQQNTEQSYPFKFCIKEELEEEEEPHYVADGTSDLPSSSEFIPGSLERKPLSTVNVHLPFMEAQNSSGFDFEIKIEPSGESSDTEDSEDAADYREEDYFPQDYNHKMITTFNPSSGKTSPSCEVCGKVFGSKSTLDKHLQIHTGQRPYPCSECEKSFSCRNHLITHQRSHTGERPFACNQCYRKFIKQQHLILHQVVHTGEKPYSCPVCGKGFTRQSSVVKHSTIHAEQKPFVCNVCGKSYCQYASLVVHLRVHSGEKPFVCKYCEKAFACKATMLKHEKSHTG